MHLHILGICGTFMGSLAVLAKQLGHTVTGCDQNVYPPMSTQLEEQGIVLTQGYKPEDFPAAADIFVIGNTCSRGNPGVEYILDRNLPYCSGPQWLSDHVLQNRWVLAVSGTHGKTTTSSMLTWILHQAGLEPGYLIGGVPKNFSKSADIGAAPFFVIEADEYDSAFFDKRSKFIHYHAKTLIIGNLEFDHADIFDDLGAIQNQFHHLIKTVPGTGLIISPLNYHNLDPVFARGVWTEQQFFSLDENSECEWHVKKLDERGQHFEVNGNGKTVTVQWQLLGNHNIQNAVAAIAAAANVGVDPEQSAQALCQFEGVKRRLEMLGEFNNTKVYDDFAHHPTAIKSTLDGFRARLRENREKGRLIAIVEARSNTMKMGYHQNTLGSALSAADQVLWYRNKDAQLDLDAIAKQAGVDFHSFTKVDDIIDFVARHAQTGDHLIIMSNGGFEGIHQKLCQALA